MTVNEILAQEWTKTKKIQHLILLGLTRREIAILVTNNNYGFVQNVYAAMKAKGLLNQQISTAFNRKFGVEIEAYNVTMFDLEVALTAEGINVAREGYNHRRRSYWKIVTDSSIRGTSAFELVSPVLEGERGLEEVKKVCKVLEEVGAKVNRSCGLHIHFDASGFDLDTFKRIFINYSRVESTIDSFMPVSRRGSNNSYCKSIKVANLEDRINAATSITGISTVFRGDRYYKVNPTSYARHNTIEFRQHSGTVEFKKIGAWINFLNGLLNASSNRLLEGSGEAILAQICAPEVIDYINARIETLR